MTNLKPAKMKTEFYIYKKGKTSDLVAILSMNGMPFDFISKVAKYKDLGYTVYDINMNQL